ncbi:ankyrin repeat domain-containing protein 31 isoform X1 [Fukomys damarensis]|uniref:ankyrin repeat domain-containing protein 31 isoform X1 n=1 Tax=Fukomys damarensis TaxID=885580 RepID=UPI0008FF0D8F|nr:ankyrin repeat domain-containing protein 31 isoform X1 [Fukomys damarensis]
MEEGAHAPDWDSDETVIEGSVAESDLEDEELPWRRFLFDRDTSLTFEFGLHPGVSGMYKDTSSPEIQLGCKLREDSQEQMNKNKVMPILSEDSVLQQPQDETEQNRGVLQTTTNFAMSTVSFPQDGFSLNQQNFGGHEAENTEVLPYLEKELNEDRDSPEISLLSNIATTVSGMVAVKEKSLIEPDKILAAPNTFYDPGKEITLTMTSEETNDEESSIETFVSALERLLRSPESTQEKRLFEPMNDFDPVELMNPLSNSSSSMSISLSALSPYCRDLLANTEDDALPPELFTALNTLSGDKAGPIFHSKKEGGSLRDRNEYLEPDTFQTNEDCTQITETVKDSNPFGCPNLAHQNVSSCDPLNNKNPNPMDNGSDHETPRVLRRSSRLEKLKVSQDAKCTEDMCKIPEKIVPKMHSCEDQIKNKSIENFRMKAPVLMIEDKKKNMQSSRFKGEQIRKNERLILKKEKLKINKMPLSSINRRNIFGETLLYKAALYDDADLVHCCIKKGANVNQPSNAGWTALHEASVGGFYRTANELLKGGADVNIKGMYQITPLHDAVVNGHHKVAELLLLSGADPLIRTDSGKCALDEAKDSRMKRLLEKYVPQCQKRLISDQRKSIDPGDVEDVHQHKKTKFSPKNHTGFDCNENINRQKPENVEVNKRSKEGLFINEDIYECYPKNSKIIKFGKSKHKQSTLKQTYCTGLRKGSVCNIKDSSTNMSEGKGRKKTQDKRTQANDGDCTSRQAVGISSSRRINAVGACQQHLDDLSEDSHEPSSLTPSILKDGLVNNVEICSVSKEAHAKHHLDLPEGQEMQFFGLEYIGQTESGSFFGPALHKEVKLPFVSTDQQPHVYQEQQSSPYKSHENSNSGEKNKTFNKWENSFLSFIKEHSDNYNDNFCISEETITSEMVTCSTECKNHYQENLNREERDLQYFLPSEDHFPQENELKESSLTTLPQHEAVNISDSDKAVISEQHVANYEQCIYGTNFDHLFGNPEKTSLTCTRTLSTHEASKLTSHVEILKKPQDNSPSESTPLMNQIDTHIMEKVYVELKDDDIKRNFSDKGQKPRLSPTVVHPQEIEITNVEKKQYLPESESITNTNFCSTNNMNKELTNISEFNQQEKEISRKPGEELTNNINEDESIVRNYEEKKEKIDSEIYMPPNTQEHKKENFRKRQSCSKATYNQDMKTTGINKRNARGESRLHSAARRGDLSLVQILIESGADVNLKDNAGWTPLHEASNEGFSDIIIELLKAGANVNCESIEGILPLHDAVAGNHLKHRLFHHHRKFSCAEVIKKWTCLCITLTAMKAAHWAFILAAEILLQHGANPNKKDQTQKTALDQADNEKMKELLKSYGALETNNRDESSAAVTVKTTTTRSKRYKQCLCKEDKTVDPPSPSHQEERRENFPMQQSISAILQDIEENQQKLLEFEIRNSKDAEQYIEKMLEIKEIMDNVLAKQKAERDDLAKKYRVSIESFKHGVLREQLANLATRQKRLLVAAKNQKNISLKIQNYKNTTSLPGLHLRKLSSSLDISSDKGSQELTRLENLGQLQDPVHLDCGSVKETALSPETWNDGQNTNICPNSRGFSRNEMNLKQDNGDCTLDDFSKSRHSHNTEKIKSSSKHVFIVQTEHSQKENDRSEKITEDHEFCSSSATSTLNISECTISLSQNDAYLSTVISDQDLSHCDPKRRNKKTASQLPPGGVSESLAHQSSAVLGTDTGHPIKSYLKKTASAIPCANDRQISSSSESGHRHNIKKPLSFSTTPKKKCMQIKDLILLGKIKPGNNILEFRTQETTHKASILMSGKIKVENGQIYQNPVCWLKDLLGGDSYVTWNYAWSKVTYLGKELLKYVSEEVSLPPELDIVSQQHQTCLPGSSSESLQSIPYYLQINEILLTSDQEFLPCHLMDQHWKFYVECEELTF